MDRYRKYSFGATICVALFIISFAFCVLCMNKTVYEKCLENSVSQIEADNGLSDTVTEITTGLKDFEAKANFDKLNDDFKSFFKSKYELIGYELDEFNVDRLNHIKNLYRLAWVITIITFIGMLYSFIILSKRRMFMPFLYGGVLAAFFTSLNAFSFIRSDREFWVAARDMVFGENYSYFSDNDIFLKIIPPEYARWMAVAYLMMVAVLILIMVLVRWFILFLGRPHKF
ncbi:MAG: hypothetical protein IJ053_05580 [Lachnospiraceae bacterium]|nr:hypothetical protein [Lachnospiraceae bacterium]